MENSMRSNKADKVEAGRVEAGRVAAGSDKAGGIKAQAHLHHAYLLGLQLMVASNKGPEVMGEWMFRLFRRQHLEKFLSSFNKLGLEGLPVPSTIAYRTAWAGFQLNICMSLIKKPGCVFVIPAGCTTAPPSVEFQPKLAWAS
jgi:hypothetical protein